MRRLREGLHADGVQQVRRRAQGALCLQRARLLSALARLGMGRQMAEGAALLADHVLPAVGYRQWVLSFSGPLAVRLGYDQALLATVAESLALILLAGEAGLRSGEIGALRWTDVDFAKREVNVRRNLVRGKEGTPKGGKARATRCRRSGARGGSGCARRGGEDRREAQTVSSGPLKGERAQAECPRRGAVTVARCFLWVKVGQSDEL